MKVSDVYGGFLEAEDLPEHKNIKLTIEGVRETNTKDKGKDGRAIEDQAIIKFSKAKKEWVLNKTNAKSIRRLYGNDMTAWVGQMVTIYRTTCNAFGNPKTPCIRVKTGGLE